MFSLITKSVLTIEQASGGYTVTREVRVQSPPRLSINDKQAYNIGIIYLLLRTMMHTLYQSSTNYPPIAQAASTPWHRRMVSVRHCVRLSRKLTVSTCNPTKMGVSLLVNWTALRLAMITSTAPVWSPMLGAHLSHLIKILLAFTQGPTASSA
jgi:hypothetical protein